MTGPEFRSHLRDLDLGMQTLARMLQMSGRTIRHYALYGLDEGAGGLQAVVASVVRILIRIPPEIRKPLIDEYVKRKRRQ